MNNDYDYKQTFRNYTLQPHTLSDIINLCRTDVTVYFSKLRLCPPSRFRYFFDQREQVVLNLSIFTIEKHLLDGVSESVS